MGPSGVSMVDSLLRASTGGLGSRFPGEVSKGIFSSPKKGGFAGCSRSVLRATPPVPFFFSFLSLPDLVS
jgi:hypothetical protein